MENRYKDGDIIVCLPGFTTNDRDEGVDNFGGKGYEEGRICKINEEKASGTLHDIWWPREGNKGFYGQAIRPATRKEAEAYHAGIRNIKDIQKDEVVNDYPLY